MRRAGDRELSEIKDHAPRVGRRVVVDQVRAGDLEHLIEVLEWRVAELGGLDVVCANARVLAGSGVPAGDGEAMPSRFWAERVHDNLSGFWDTLEVAIALLVDRQRGGLIVVPTPSFGHPGSAGAGSTQAVGPLAAVAATRDALSQFVRTYARDLAPHAIRLNAIHPAEAAEFWALTTAGVSRCTGGELDDAVMSLLEGPGRRTTGTTLWVQGECTATDIAQACLATT